MRIGMLTGGGDCPGLNAVIRAVVRKGEGDYGHTIVGYRHGWRGVLEGESMELSISSRRAGCCRAAARSSGRRARIPYKTDDGAAPVLATLARDARRRADRDRRRGHARRRARSSAATACSVVGVPKTIDNDLSATDFTFGFHTAVQIATDAIDRLHTTAESHDRVMVVEVMGRHAGWIATYSGLAGGADIILIPEKPFDIDEICDAHHAPPPSAARTSRSSSSPRARRRWRARWSCRPARSTTSATSGSAGSATGSPTEIEQRTGLRGAHDALGHVLRGGSPTAYDRVIATRFGIEAIDAVHEGDFGEDGRAARHRRRPGPDRGRRRAS